MKLSENIKILIYTGILTSIFGLFFIWCLHLSMLVDIERDKLKQQAWDRQGVHLSLEEIRAGATPICNHIIDKK